MRIVLRTVALLFGAGAAFSAPATALSHAVAHDHERAHAVHHCDGHTDGHAPVVRAEDHGHGHDHPPLDLTTRSRGTQLFAALPAQPPVITVAAIATPQTVPPFSSHARPPPGDGRAPPPSRAPPAL